MTDDIGIRVVVLGVSEARRSMGTVRSDLNGLTAAIQKASGASSTLATRLGALGSGLSRLGRTLSLTVTAPVTLMGASLLKAGIDFEDAFAGVSKTVEGVSDKLGNLTTLGKQIRAEFRALALDIPVSAVELANLGEQAGALGVPVQQLTGFVEIISKFGVATNLSATEAGDAIARFANIMGISANDLVDFTKRAGSAIVDLGNKSAATESEIVNLVYRISGAGKAIGLTAQEIIAISTLVAELGIRSEQGGSAVSRILLEIQSAVSEGGDKLEMFAKASGTTADAFREMVRNSPIEAFKKVVGGLASMQEQGQLTSDTLTDLDLNTIRLRDVVNRFGPDMSRLTTNIQTANQAWSDATALEIEAEKRYKTVKSQLILLRNTFNELGIVLFDLYKNEIVAIIDSFKKFVKYLTELDSGLIKTIVKVALLGAALGPVLILVGTLFQIISAGIAGLTALGSALGFLAVPLAAVVAGLVAFGIAWNKNIGGLRDKGTKVVKSIKYVGYWIEKAFNFGKNQKRGNLFTGIASGVKALTYVFKDNKRTFFGEFLKSLGVGEEKANSFGMKIRDFLTPIILKISNAFTVVGETVRAVMIYLNRGDFDLAIVAVLQGVLRLLGTDSEEAVQYAFRILEFGKSVVEFGKQVALFFVNDVLPVLVKVVTWIVNDFAPVVADIITDDLIPAFKKIADFLVDLWNTVQPSLSALYNWFITDALPAVVQFIKGTVSPTLKDFVIDVRDLWDKVSTKLRLFYDWFKTKALPEIVNFINTFVRPQIKLFIEDLKRIWTDVEPFLRKVFDWFYTTALPTILNFLNGSVATAIQKLIDKIKKIWDDTEEARNSIYAWFAETLPNALEKFTKPAGEFIQGIINKLDILSNSAKTRWDKAFGKIEVPQALKDAYKYLYDINQLLSGQALGKWISENVFGQESEVTGKLAPSAPVGAKGGNIIGPTIVGEKGKELFMPQTSGFLLSNNMLKNIASILSSRVMNQQTTNYVNRSVTFAPTINGAQIRDENAMSGELYRVYRMMQPTYG